MQYYVPRGQESGFSGSALLIRPRGGLRSVGESFRLRLQELDPSLTHVNLTPLQQSLDPQMRPWRLGAALFGLCGVLALLVTAVGLYSVLSYMVAERAHEIGVRVALGATGKRVTWFVVRSGALLAVAGMSLGLAVALLAGGWVEPLLFDTSGRDPLVLGTVVVVLFLVAAIASLIPAGRAAAVSPMTALRGE
jgi:ABC-type lipoprotein release transport system permease subunit